MAALGTDRVAIDRGGTNYRLTLAEIAALASGGGGTLSGTASLSLPNGNGVLEWKEVEATPGVLATDKIMVMLAPGTDSDENTADMIDLLTLSATAAVDSITVSITFTTPHSGPILIYWKVL